jgi:hypothetical protein
MKNIFLTEAASYLFRNESALTDSGSLYGINRILNEHDELIFAVASEQAWAEINETAAVGLLEAVRNNDEVLYENTLGDYWERVKEFFKKLWQAIKQFISGVWMRILKVFMTKKAFVEKYQAEIEDGASKLGDREFIFNKDVYEKFRESFLKAIEEEEKTIKDALRVYITSDENKPLNKQIGKNFFDDGLQKAIETYKNLVNNRETTRVNSNIVKVAINIIKNASAYKDSINEVLKTEEEIVKIGASVANTAAKATKSDDTEKEKQKKKVEAYKKVSSAFRSIRNMKLSGLRYAVNDSWAIVKACASKGKPLYKKG